eukprot:TRINITY_DN18487_c0_g1_i1.p1 TRINITY_DN18487_c0_g1~~TRINITY_DN18487_c0_g1_i1.p1  ORF type:complete len:664 (-),score=125.15 TRINITY_DN18487_c0_g1_i1:192-2114(-)
MAESSAAAAQGSAEFGQLLAAAQALPPDWLAVWDEPQQPTSEVVLGTVELLCAALRKSCASLVVELLSPAPTAAEAEVLALGCTQLEALDALLARVGEELTRPYAAQILAHLEASSDALSAHSCARLLWPSNSCLDPIARVKALRLPMYIFVRCVGVENFTARELLALGRADLATAVAIAVAGMKGPSNSISLQLRPRLWQILCDLSTPQFAAEHLAQAELNSTPIEELVGQHCVYAHRMSVCLAQFGALEALCDCAEDSRQRSAVLVPCLRMIHNLTASPNLWSPGRILARQMAFLWQRFGFRLLVPQLRRLLATSESSGNAGLVAAREFRRDLRTLGWVLHHAPEVREHARPVCVELSMKVARGDHPAETLAVAVGVVANADALNDRGRLYAMLDDVEDRRKQEVCATFPSETNRLWIIEQAWDIVEDLGYWPKDQPSAPEANADSGLADALQREADFAAMRKLQPTAGAGYFFDFLDPECDCDAPYEDWEDDEDWADSCGYYGYSQLDSEEAEADEGDYEPAPDGPLGWLGVAPPPAPGSLELEIPVAAESGSSLKLAPMALLCSAPDPYRCALDGRLCLEEPVRTQNGVLFARRSIAAWLAWNKVCPVTGAPLALADLVPDTAVGEAIASWLSAPP